MNKIYKNFCVSLLFALSLQTIHASGNIFKFEESNGVLCIRSGHLIEKVKINKTEYTVNRSIVNGDYLNRLNGEIPSSWHQDGFQNGTFVSIFPKESDSMEIDGQKMFSPSKLYFKKSDGIPNDNGNVGKFGCSLDIENGTINIYTSHILAVGSILFARGSTPTNDENTVYFYNKNLLDHLAKNNKSRTKKNLSVINGFKKKHSGIIAVEQKKIKLKDCIFTNCCLSLCLQIQILMVKKLNFPI